MHKYHSNRLAITSFNHKEQQQYKGKSLKPSSSTSNKQYSCLTKRLSLQYKPTKKYKRNSIIDNIEQYQYLQLQHVNKTSNNLISGGRDKISYKHMAVGMENDKLVKLRSQHKDKHNNKYYTKINNKMAKTIMNKNRCNNSIKEKEKNMFNQISKNAMSKYSKSSKSSKYISCNRRQIEKEEKHRDNSSQFCRQSPTNQITLDNAQSALNSTILTKHISERPKSPFSNNHYDILLKKMKAVLQKYNKRIHTLKEQKQFYRIKWRMQKKKNVSKAN